MADLKKLFHELARFETETRSAVDARLRAEHGLSLSRFEPLQIIATTENCRVYDIAEALSLTTGGASKLVDSLEAAKLCRRKPNPADRRSSIVFLTAAGERLYAGASKTFEDELEARIGSVLPDRSVELLSSSLVRLRQRRRRLAA